MRSLLFTPGSSTKMIAKALGAGADIVILDLEDAVHPDLKKNARYLVADALSASAQRPCQIYVRINPLDSEWLQGDLETVMPFKPDGIMLPKPNRPDDIDRLGSMMLSFEARADAGRTPIIAVCTETPEATLSLAATSWRRPRLAGMLWGGEDLSAELGTTFNRDAGGIYTSPFAMARNLCLFAARAAGVAPIDAVYTDFGDTAGLRDEANMARRDGFAAKAAIHPAQIPTINDAFGFTQQEREWAVRVVEAMDASQNGVAQIDGKMLDMPHLKQARRILAAEDR